MSSLTRIPNWTAPFLSLFIISAFMAGSVKVCGVFFLQINSQFGLNGSLSGLIFVIPAALSYIISPIVGALSIRFSSRQMCTFGGFLVGSSFTFIGLFGTHWIHLVLLASGAGVGFGFLYFPTVLCLHSRAADSVSILMPLSSIGSSFGLAVLPVITEMFLRQYGLRAAFCLFGALTWYTIPCSLLLDNKPVREEENVKDQNVNRDDIQEVGRLIAFIRDEVPLNSLGKQRNRVVAQMVSRKSHNSDVTMALRIDHTTRTNLAESNVHTQEGKFQNVCDDSHERKNRLRTFTENAPSSLNESLHNVYNILLSIATQFRMFSNVLFVLIFIATIVRKFVADTWALFLIPHNVEMGVERTDAVLVASIGGIGGMIGRLVAAVAFTKTIAKLHLGALSALYLLCGVSLVSFELASSTFYFCLCGFLSGLFLSAQSGMISGIIIDVFEPEEFRKVFAIIDLGCGVFSLVSAYIAGGVYDLTGSFRMIFRFSALASVSGSALVFIIMLRRKAH